jgi:hypothetical protein
MSTSQAEPFTPSRSSVESRSTSVNGPALTNQMAALQTATNKHVAPQ